MRDIAPKKKPPSSKPIARKARKPSPRAPAADPMKTMTDLLDRYGLPGAAALAGGAAIAAGIVLHDPLERMLGGAMRSVMAGGTSARRFVVKDVGLETLLERIGVRRHRSPVAIGLGVLGGLVATSALAFWLAPYVRDAFDRPAAIHVPGEPPATRAPGFAESIDATA